MKVLSGQLFDGTTSEPSLVLPSPLGERISQQFPA